MKNFLKTTTFVSLTILFFSCSSSKHAVSYVKLINGNWQLKSIVSEGVTGKMNMKLFDEADFNCFVGSSWTFNNKSHLGNYAISKNAGECAGTKRDIAWSIDEPSGQDKQFYFKRIDSNSEFRFTIMQLVKDSMQIKSNTVVDGQSATLTYKFVRI